VSGSRRFWQGMPLGIGLVLAVELFMVVYQLARPRQLLEMASPAATVGTTVSLLSAIALIAAIVLRSSWTWKLGLAKGAFELPYALYAWSKASEITATAIEKTLELHPGERAMLEKASRTVDFLIHGSCALAAAFALFVAAVFWRHREFFEPRERPSPLPTS
jgi:hypothetical protein